MSGGDLLLVLARVAHLVAAAAWVGGSIAYSLVGRPAPGAGARSFSWLVGVCTWVLAFSGAALTADRLVGGDAATPLYAGLLVLKVGLALAMFILAGTLVPSAAVRLRARRRPAATAATAPARSSWFSRPHLVLGMGLAVYALGSALAVTYTRAVASR